MGHRGEVVLRYKNLFISLYFQFCRFSNSFGKLLMAELINILRNDEQDMFQMKLIDLYLYINQMKNTNYLNMISGLVINILREKTHLNDDVIHVILDYINCNNPKIDTLDDIHKDKDKIIDIDCMINNLFRRIPNAHLYGLDEDKCIMNKVYDNTESALKEFTDNRQYENVYIIDFERNKIHILENGIWGPRDLTIHLKTENIGILENCDEIIKKLNYEYDYDPNDYDPNASQQEILDLLQENSWIIDPELNNKIDGNGPFPISSSQQLTRQQLREIIACNDMLKGIKTSGKGRTNKAITKDINDKINAFHKENNVGIKTKWKYINPYLFCLIDSKMANEYQQIRVEDQHNVFIDIPRNYEKRTYYDIHTERKKQIKADREYIEKVTWLIDHD